MATVLFRITLVFIWFRVSSYIHVIFTILLHNIYNNLFSISASEVSGMLLLVGLVVLVVHKKHLGVRFDNEFV